MKCQNYKNLVYILMAIVITMFSTIAFADDFYVISIKDNWNAQDFGALNFKSASLAFDSNNNLYANDLRSDFEKDHYEIYVFSAPSYDFSAPTLYATMDKTFEVISGINFDEKGNLYLSEVISEYNFIGYDYPDAGLIRKISANTKSLSDPVIYLSFRPTGIAALSPHKVYFSGRKWSAPTWGNIYKISNFESFEKSSDPNIAIENKVWTAIATDKWGTIFGAPRFDQTGSTIYAQNPYTGSFQWMATLSKLIEELTIDADGNLYAIEQTNIDQTEIIKLIPPKIIINGCDTKIIDWTFNDGTKISDIIDGCNEYSSHGEYVSCVTRSVNPLIQDGYINGKQFAAIVTCAANSDKF